MQGIAAMQSLGPAGLGPRCRLLCFSREPILLETRLQILPRYYFAEGAQSLRDVEQAVRNEFDLVLVCHSIPESERHAIISFARERWPKAKIVRITKQGRELQPDGSDAAVAGSDGPAALLRAVAGLLRPRLQVS